MSKYDFILLDEKEARDMVVRRLWSNGYTQMYDLFSVDIGTGDILLQCCKCGMCVHVCLKDIENGSLSKVCRGCVEKEKQKKLKHQRSIAGIVAKKHLKLISIDADNYLLKCNICGHIYKSGEDFLADASADEVKGFSCKNSKCIFYSMLQDYDCTDIYAKYDIEFEDIDEWEDYFTKPIKEIVTDEEWREAFTSAIEDFLEYQDGYVEKKCSKCGRVSLEKIESFREPCAFCNHEKAKQRKRQAVPLKILNKMIDKYDSEERRSENEILTMKGYEFLDTWLNAQGICGYTDKIMEVIEIAFGVNLNRYPFTIRPMRKSKKENLN